MTSTVRTRFAPSPTGYMHIGGMRTALFNWLWARHNNGQFILRIDDTDAKRHEEAALAPIFRAFQWLGLDWDEGPDVGGPHAPYYQSQRSALYQTAVEKLLAAGRAFRDYNTPEQNQADREAATKAGQPWLNVRRSLDLTDADREQLDAEGRGHVIRLLVPRDRSLTIKDLVRGAVTWSLSEIADPAIARSDGSPLYNLATVVDDAAMEISDIIRAEEHISNTPAQFLLHEALGSTPPNFAHISFVTAPGSTKKLSKRDIKKYRNNQAFRKLFETGDRVFPQILPESLENIDETLNPVMVQYYEIAGYLPAGLLNGLARLGWAFDDKTEYVSRDFLIENFTLDRVIKSPAGFDPEKLTSYQSHWMNALSLEEKLEGCLPHLLAAGMLKEPVSASDREYVGRVIEIMGERIVIFSDILKCGDFFCADDQLEYDEKNFKKRLVKPESAVAHLTAFRDQLQNCNDWSAAALETELANYTTAAGISTGEIIHALRIATTGKAQGPGMFDCLSVLGKTRCLQRIEQTLARV